ncbi:hypothetical protein [Chroococcidiopsis sp.]|uniref:hypothetical protein n=1 Tax=Chroococcidiopsis sp. TaxID=3088168 RepID=UPI003F416C62
MNDLIEDVEQLTDFLYLRTRFVEYNHYTTLYEKSIALQNSLYAIRFELKCREKNRKM